MPLFPSRTELADTYPNPSNSVFKTGIGKLWDAVTGLLGTTGTKEDALDALRANGPDDLRNISLVPSVGSSAFTMNVKTAAGAAPSASDPVMLSQRSATLGNGDFTPRKITTACFLVFSSGSTLGLSSASSVYIYYYLIDNAGTQELAASVADFGQSGIVSTTAEGGAGGADSSAVMYSTTARTNVPFRRIGRMKAPQTTAGVWAAVPTEMRLLTMQDFGYEQNTFTITAVGLTTSPTAVVNYTKIGNLVTIVVPPLSGTSNSTGFSVSGIPAALRPNINQYFSTPMVKENSIQFEGHCAIRTDGTIQYFWDGPETNFTASGFKGMVQTNVYTYSLY